MVDTVAENLKQSFLAEGRNRPDFYEGFDVAEWSKDSQRGTAVAVYEFMAANKGATTEDVINFSWWVEDQIEDGKL